MKKIRYLAEMPNLYDDPEFKGGTIELLIPYSADGVKQAVAQSVNGEYTIEDDGKPEPAPTQLDRIEAQTTYTAMMTDTLMEG